MILSLHYGIPVKRLQQEVDSQEFSELMARHLFIEPIGQPWKQLAQLCAVITGLFDKKAKPENYLPLAKLSEAPSDFKAQLKAFAKMHNAMLKNK